MYMVKAKAAVIYIWSLRAIPLSKIIYIIYKGDVPFKESE
jgi:hypothetical protein